MSGIVGIICKEKNEGLSRGLSKMADSIKHRGGSEKHAIVDKRIGFAVRHHEDSAYGAEIYENDECLVAVDGNFRNKAELNKFVATQSISCPAHLMWKGYNKAGLQFLDRIDGSFAAVIYDRRTDVVVLSRDIFGQRPLYYGCQQGNFWFSSEIKGVLAAPGFVGAVNQSEISSTLAFGVTVGPETLLKNLFKVLPGYAMRGSPGHKLDCRLYFDPASIQPAKGLTSMDEFANEIWQVLGTSTSDQLNGSKKNGLFLSSGIDSALVALQLSKVTHSKAMAITCGYRDNPNHDESEKE